VHQETEELTMADSCLLVLAENPTPATRDYLFHSSSDDSVIAVKRLEKLLQGPATDCTFIVKSANANEKVLFVIYFSTYQEWNYFDSLFLGFFCLELYKLKFVENNLSN
jgi:hypothetical protein